MQLLSFYIFLAVASTSALVVAGATTMNKSCKKCSRLEQILTEDVIPLPLTPSPVQETAESSASGTDTGLSTDVVETAVGKTTKLSDSTTETSPFATSTLRSPLLEPIPLEVDEAKLSANTKFIQVDGKATILLTPSPNTWAYVSLKATDMFPLGSLVKFAASFRVATMDRWPEPAIKEGKTGSRLQIKVNGKAVYDKELVITGSKFQKAISDTFPSSEDPRIDIIQKSGDKAIAFAVKDPELVFDSEINDIEPPESTSTDSADRGAQANKAWIAGPFIGGCVGLAFVVGVILFFRRRRARWMSPHHTDGADGLYKKPELHADCIPQASRDIEGQATYEMQGSIPQPSEIAADKVPVQKV